MGTLLAIFGAGASHGCLATEPDEMQFVDRPLDSNVDGTRFAFARPPLTQELIRPDVYAAVILNRYEAALPVMSALRQRLAITGDGSPTVSLERALADYQDQAEVDPQVRRHLTAMRFFLRDLLWACSELMRSPSLGAGDTNQLAIVRVLHTWAMRTGSHVCLTSFNYDTILEAACRAVWAFNPYALDHYVSYAPMSVLKPHGSVLWERLLENQEAAPEPTRVYRAIDLMFDQPPLAEVVAVMPPGIEVRRPPGVPALALPVDGKSELVWPAEQDEHFGLQQSQVSKLLVIGWRAVDQHFVDRMQRLAGKAKVVIVTGGPYAEQEAIDIRERLWDRVLDTTMQIESVIDGFSGFLAGNRLQWLLED